MSGGTRQLWRAFAAEAEPFGYRLVTTNKGHAKLIHPKRRPIPVPSSPKSDMDSCVRMLRQTMRRAEKEGGR